MILECPSCTIRFKIPDGAVAEGGQRVRCGKCRFIWKVMPPQAVTAEAGADREHTPKAPLPKMTSGAPDIDQVMAGKTHQASEGQAEQAGPGQKKPKKAVIDETVIGDYQPPKPIKNRKLTLLVYLLLGIIFLAISAGLWSLQHRSDWWGLTDSGGLAFEEIELIPMPRLGGDRFTMNPLFKVVGTVRNISDKPKMLPIIRVTLKDASGETIYTRQYVDQTLIPSGNVVDFVMENLEQAERRHTYFIVEMGNKAELALRSVGDIDAN